MLNTLLHTIRAQSLIPPHSWLVVGVSGGADSLALLHLLRALAPALDCRLHAATFDHGLRGAAGAADARFVADTAAAWGVPVTVGQGDVRDLARRSKLSIEAAARQARYAFLAETARQVGAARVAVGHHADDQAETVLLHLLRGSGIGGLAGMAAQSPLPEHPDLTLIRPLLDVSRADIEAYCRANKLHPREDATNADAAYLRNRLRHETLPHLQTINPQIIRVLAQLADVAATETDFVETQLQAAVERGAADVTPGRVLLHRDLFNQLHPALQRRLVAWSVAQVTGSKQDIAYVHIVTAVEVARRGRLGAVAELPGGLRLRVDYAAYTIEYADAPQAVDDMPLLDADEEIAVAIPGVTRFSSRWDLVADFAPHSSPSPTHGDGLQSPMLPPLHLVQRGIGGEVRLAIPPDSRVTLRARRAGDRFAPPGLSGHTQKVSRWLVNQKIPLRLRDRLPVLVVNGVIAALIVGGRWVVSEHFSVQPVHQHIVHFQFRQFP